MKVLMTGFDPFGGESVNPAYEAVKALPGEIEGAQIIKREVPTVYGKAARILKQEMEKIHPDIVICVGQAGGRAGISIEKVAINYRDARIQDNAGNQPQDCPILAEGTDAYFATLPVKKIVAELQKAGIPAQISYSAGTFVCNDIFYSLMHMAANEYPGIKAGFIHVPFIPLQVVDKENGTASMALDMIVEALEVAIRVSLAEE